MVFNKLAAGKKVYGRGSYAPTRGTVDPSGYIKREVRRRNIKVGPRRPTKPTPPVGTIPRAVANTPPILNKGGNRRTNGSPLPTGSPVNSMNKIKNRLTGQA